jgi:transcriptional regulator with XRE-family HTH domain
MHKARRFHEQLRETREKARQSTEVMGILLNMQEDEYIAIERGEVYPDNETLRRLCMMLEWNFYDTRRGINNEIAARRNAAAPGGAAALQALQDAPVAAPGTRGSVPDSLGQRLRQVRESTGQTVEIISMLLGIPPELYHRLEAGEAPGDDLLRRISVIYDWNYNDLRYLLRTEQAGALQPRRMGSPFPGTTAHGPHLRAVLHEVESLFAGLPEKDQQFVLTQLELVRETLRRLRQAS